MQTRLMTDGLLIPLSLKSQILKDWRRFIRGGFRLEDYSPDLHQHLISYGRFYHEKLSERENFWRHYFGASLDRLRYFLKRFALIETEGTADFGIALYHHTEDLNRNLYLEFEDVRCTLLEVVAAIRAEIDQFNIIYLAHVAHANEPARSFEVLRQEIAADYNPALARVEVTVSNDIREALAHPFRPPAIRITQPVLWALGGSRTNGHQQNQNEAEPAAFLGWNPDEARERLQNQSQSEQRIGSTHGDHAHASSTTG